MTTPQPQTPGDQREDHAQTAADAVAAIYAGVELVLIATLAALARKVAAGHMTRANAARKLQQATRATFAASVRKISRAVSDAMAATDQAARQALHETVPSEPTAVRDMLAYTRQLAQSLDQAADTATAALQDALTTVTDAAADVTEAAPTAPLRAIPGPQNIFSPYHDAVNRAIADTRGGMPGSSLSLSRIQAAQKALDDLASRGITGFTDRAGRNWDLASYVEMATRTAVSNAWDDMQAKAMIRSGLDLIRTYTTSTEGSCPLCIPWLGRVLSLTGATPGYATLDEAKAAGFRHPNCRCSWVAVGAETAYGASSAPLEQAAAAYKASQKQRALERAVRKAGRQAHAAVTPQARSKARRNLAAARAASAQHRKQAPVIMTKVSAARREHPFNAR